MRMPPRELRKPRIEIIPMIDTIFFLLVFFMLSSLTLVHMKAMRLTVPASAGPAGASKASETPKPPSTLVLTVTDTGRYYVNKTQIAPPNLGAALQAKIAADPSAVVVLNLAKTQTTQTLIRIMDTLNKLQTPGGQGVRALVATEPVDFSGRALPAAVDLNGRKEITHVP